MIEIKKPSFEDVKTILFDDDIFQRTNDDNFPTKESLNFKKLSDVLKYFGIYLDNKIIGFLLLEPNNYIHYQVLKPYRKDYASKALKMILDLIEKPIYCEIATLHQNVIDFALKNGFKITHTRKNALLKKGIFYDGINLIYN